MATVHQTFSQNDAISTDSTVKDHHVIEASPVDFPAVHKQLVHGEHERSTAMKVLVVGMPGTSTSLVVNALNQLGVSNIYDTKCLLDPKSSAHRQQLLKLHDSNARKRRNIYFTASDFDPVLANYEAVVDWPAAAYATDLMIAYRSARVILTVLPSAQIRPWRSRLQSVYHALQTSPLIKLLLYYNISDYRTTHHLLETMFRGFFDGDILQHAQMSYKIHQGRIRGTLNLQGKSETDDVLSFDPSRPDWVALYKFLGAQPPKSGIMEVKGNETLPAFDELEPWRLFVRYADYWGTLSISTAFIISFLLYWLVPYGLVLLTLFCVNLCFVNRWMQGHKLNIVLSVASTSIAAAVRLYLTTGTEKYKGIELGLLEWAAGFELVRMTLGLLKEWVLE